MSDFKKLIDTLSSIENQDSIELYDSVDLELNEHFVIETGVIGFMEDGIILEADEKTLEFLELNNIILESEELDEISRRGFLGTLAAGGAAAALGSKMLDQPNEPTPAKEKITLTTGAQVPVYKTMEELKSKGFGYNDFVRAKGENPLKIIAADGQQYYLFLAGKEVRGKAISVENYNSSLKENSLNRNDITEAEYQGRKVPLNKPMKGDVKKSKVYVKKPNGSVVKVNFGDPNMRIKKSNPKRRKSFRARHRCENPGPKWKARYWSCRAW